MLRILFIGLISLSFLGCNKEDDPPNYPNEPYIEFVDAYIAYAHGKDQDSLVVKVRYRDGDGDLGLTIDQNLPPYHHATYFNRNSPYEAVYDFINFEGELLKLGDRPGGLDTLPEYNCKEYRVVGFSNEHQQYRLDTLYRQINENAYNFYVDVFKKTGDKYEYYDIFEETCVPVNGIFPLENKVGSPFTIKKSSQWEGTITYNFRLYEMNQYWGGDSIKLQISIKDRALNRSNTVESPSIYVEK